MQLLTPVAIPPQGIALTHSTRLLSVGSCFADEMGCRLQRAGFDVLNNPFGTLYNPLSIAANLERAWRDSPLPEELMVQHDGVWHSWMHHSRFSSPDREECLRRCNDAIHSTHCRLHNGDDTWMLVTFGTAWVYYHHGQVVANCHKVAAQEFVRRRLTVEEIVSAWQGLLDDMVRQSHRPASKASDGTPPTIIFTVSPIRHLSDTAHGNQLSKATLLMAEEQLVEQYPFCHYFDSYEILIDELRDYRYYARDMCHPSELAADIIFERFCAAYMSPSTIRQCALNEKAARGAAHHTIIDNNPAS